MNSRSLKTEFGEDKKVDKYVQNTFLWEKYGDANATGFAASSLVLSWLASMDTVAVYHFGENWSNVVLWVTGRNLSMELEVTLPP